MSISRREKRFWRDHFRISTPNKAALEIDHLNYRDTELTDEQLCFLTTRINRISRLDLDGTLVTNEGIACLIMISEIKELRLKGLAIDDKCVPRLRELKSLEILHLGSTDISCHGIASLTPLKNLRRLICSPPEILPEKLLEFQQAIPDCELLVNYKLWNKESHGES